MIYMEKLVDDIKKVMINENGNSCPLILRLAWHASGTYDKADNLGGSNGATMRFEPESTDDANAGLDKARQILDPVKRNIQKYQLVIYGRLQEQQQLNQWVDLKLN